MGTVSKALELLSFFSQTRPLVGLSDLARLSGTNKATCYRLMSELQDYGFVEQTGTAREYRLGPAVLGLAAIREATVPTREAAMPVLQRMAEQTGETAHLSHRVGDRLVTLAFAYSGAHGTRVMMEDADTLPWHATSSGIAVLAFLPEAEREAILSRPLSSHTALTETDATRLQAMVATARARGAAETKGTFETDVQSYAVPLFGPAGNCVGAVGIVLPAVRATPTLLDAVAAETHRAAAEITHLWGGQLPPDIAATPDR